MKKVWPAVLCLLFLCSCGKEIDRAEAMQEQYKNLASYETDVRVSVPRGDETLVYALHLSAQGDAVRATVSEPEELTGVGAVLEGDKLTLTFDDLVLDVGTLSPRVSALSCVPLVLQNFPKVYLDSSGAETIGDVDALRADFSLTLSGETLACGTGSTAALAVTARLGKCGDEADVILRGGKLHIAWDREQNLLYMTGPAAFVFDGTVTL